MKTIQRDESDTNPQFASVLGFTLFSSWSLWIVVAGIFNNFVSAETVHFALFSLWTCLSILSFSSALYCQYELDRSSGEVHRRYDNLRFALSSLVARLSPSLGVRYNLAHNGASGRRFFVSA